MAFVYWIHLPEHTDITKEGYVGFTSKPVNVRFKQHKSPSNIEKYSHLPLYKAFKKYGEVVVSTVVEGSSEYCLHIENILRPSERIGWNVGTGGYVPSLGLKRSEETKAKLKLIASDRNRKSIAKFGARMSGKTHSVATKQSFSESRSMWRNDNAKDIWLSCVQISEDYALGLRQCEIMSKYNFTKRMVSRLLSHLRNGWNPNEDQEYLSWLKERTGNVST